MQSKNSRLVSLSLLLLAAAGVYAQNPTRKCNQSARECEQEIRQMLTGRLYLGIEVEEKNPGLMVKNVAPDSPAWRAGLDVGDRLMAVSGHVTSQASIREFKAVINHLLDQLPQDSRRAGRLSFTVARRGILQKVEVRPEPYSKAQIDKIVAQHLLEAHTSTAQQGPTRQQ
jgi:predicted metalloprotease with PDZ domain